MTSFEREIPIEVMSVLILRTSYLDFFSAKYCHRISSKRRCSMQNLPFISGCLGDNGGRGSGDNGVVNPLGSEYCLVIGDFTFGLVKLFFLLGFGRGSSLLISTKK